MQLLLLGWVPPGYNYLGPGNTDFNAKETNASDAAAKKHDLAYNSLLKEGHNPYIYYNQADEDFIKDTDQAKDWGGRVGNLVFRAKRAIAPALGTPKKKAKPNPEPSFSWKNIKPGTKRGKPFYIFVNRARAAKKQKLSEPMSDNGQPGEQSDQPAATSGGSGSFGGGGGGSGVGHSTGSFNNRTEFHYRDGEVIIVCHATRHIHINMSEKEEYLLYQTDHGPMFPTNQSLAGRDTINDSYHAKVQTPWYLLHANSWGVWFSPADFQQVTATCTELEILDFEQTIDNIVIKTVHKQGTGVEETTQYNNDLTALLEIAEDKSNQLPWVSDNVYIDSIGYVPWRPSVLPIYCYHVNFWNTIDPNIQVGETWNWAQIQQQIAYGNIQFVTVENLVDIELLRTGDRWDSGPYRFHSKPTKLSYNWQSNRHAGSCHPSTTPNTIGGIGQNIQQPNGWQWGDRSNPMSASTRVQNFHIGYQWPEWQFHYSTGGPSVNPGAPSSMVPWLDPQTSRLTTGAAEKAIYDYGHGAEAPQSFDRWFNGNEPMTGQTDFAPRNLHMDSLSNNIPAANNTWRFGYHNTFGPFTAVDDVGIQYPWGAIWGKIPDTTHQPMMSAHAPFMCKNGPPGQLLVKLAPNYTDVLDNNGNSSRIVTYGTFWWTGRLVFRGRIRTPRQFNPYNYPAIPSTKPMKDFVPNELGHFEIPFMPGRAMPNFCY